MKKNAASVVFTLFTAVLITVLSSCVQNNLDSAPEVPISGLAVPGDFNWATIKSAQLTVVPADTYNSQYYYTVAVYGENPLFNSAAPLLAKGVTKGGSAFVTSLTLPTSATEIYVRQIDPTQKEIIQSVAITGTALTCDFNKVTTKSASAMSGMPSLRSANIAAVDPTPAGSVILTSKSGDVKWENNKNYVIPAGETYTGSMNLGQNSNLYIEGTYSLTGKKAAFAIADGGKLVIQSAGKLSVSSDVDLSFHIGQIKNFGSLVADGKFTLNSKSTMYNIGTMAFASFNTQNADNQIVNDGAINAVNFSVQSNPFTNNGSFNVTGVFEAASNSVLANNGSVEVSEFDSKAGAIIYNNCHINVKTLMDLHNTKYFGYKGSLVKADLLQADGTDFAMSEGSILDADDAAFTTNKNYINGSGSDYALARFGKVESYKNAVAKNITYQGKLEIECSNHQANDKNNPFWVVEGSNVRWSAAGASTTNIASTGCNDGGNVVKVVNPEPPTNPNFPISVNLTTNYSFLMEDNWPLLGDYDLNDLVVELNISYMQNADNKATEMTVGYKLRAAGASKKIAGAFRLDKITPAQISSVSYKTPVLTGSVFATEKGGLETGQSKAVIPMFDDAHLWLNPATGATPSLINTIIGGEYHEPVADEVRIVFTNPIDPADISISNLNFFIVTNAPSPSSRRSEVHLSGFAPSDKADPSLFGTAADYSLNGARYRTVDNMMWGLLIPTSFKYAAEWKDITTVYPQFTQWCTSGGVDNAYWYEYPTDKSGFVFSK